MACANVPGSYHQADGQFSGKASGAEVAGYQLKPEIGKSYSVGFVYDPRWIEGLSVSADWWHIDLEDTITGVSAQTVVNQCYANLPDTTDPSTVTIHNGGMYTYAYGNFPRWRGLGALSWSMDDWSASWRARYICKTHIGSSDLDQGLSADTDKAGLYYSNNGGNGNTDVATYDVLGRYYWCGCRSSSERGRAARCIPIGPAASCRWPVPGRRMHGETHQCDVIFPCPRVHAGARSLTTLAAPAASRGSVAP